jgi:hypothetical protein
MTANCSNNSSGTVGTGAILKPGNGNYQLFGGVSFFGNISYFCKSTIDTSGHLLGHTFFGAPNHNRNEMISIQPTSDSGYILSGQTDDSFDDIYIYKTGTNGQWDFIWDTLMQVNENETVANTIETSDGGFVIGATSSGDSTCGSIFDFAQFRLIKLGGIFQSVEEETLSDLTVLLTGSFLSLCFGSSQNSYFKITLSDITGRIVFSSLVSATFGINKKEIGFPGLSKGICIFTLTGKGVSKSIKVVME